MTTPMMGNYHPLTIISYSWEYLFFHLHPLPYHVVNIVIHLLNCVLVFYLILRLGRSLPVAFLVGLFFGIHPLHVESVAWISERKDVLYTFFYLLSLITYLSYLDKQHAYKHYAFALFFFVLSLFSKPMAVTLPLVLFLMDYFRKRPFAYRSIIEKVPFLLLSLGSGIATIITQNLSEHSNPAFSFPTSILVACHGLVFYLWKMIWPVKLAALYQYPSGDNLLSHIEYLISPALVLFIAAAVFYSRKFSRKAVWGGLFYLVTLLPVIQLLPIGFAVASDRYTYVPLIGIFYVISEFVVWLWSQKLKDRLLPKVIMAILFAAITAQLLFLTAGLCRVWNNSITLWTNVIKLYPNTDIAYNNRGNMYFQLGDFDRALGDFLKAADINPQFASAYNNICNTYFAKKENEKAVEYCTRALKINPRQPNTYAILGDIYWASDKPLALEMYRKSTALGSYLYDAGYGKLCDAYLLLQKYDEAYPVCNAATRFRPDDTWLYERLGDAYLKAKQYDRALFFYSRAILIDPNLPAVHNNLAVIYYYMNNYALSVKHFDAAVSLGYKVDPEFRDLIEKSRTLQTN